MTGSSWAAIRVGLPVAALALALAFGAGFSAADLTHGAPKVLASTRAPTTTTTTSTTTTAPPPTTTTVVTTTTAAPVQRVVVPTTAAPVPVATTVPPCTGGVTSTITTSSRPDLNSYIQVTINITVRNGRTDPIDNVIVSYHFPGLEGVAGNPSPYQVGTPIPTPIPVGGSATFSQVFQEATSATASVTLIDYSDTSSAYGCGNGSEA